ncbi:MAG: serine/threonine-protein kinase [Luteolibacter sp.]
MSHSFFEVPEFASLDSLLPGYEIEHLITISDMGVVFKAHQISLDREVAIKILPRELGNDPLFRSSFEAEAKAMACLTHPNLIRVFDSGEVEGILYMVMEYVPGKSLHHSSHGIAIDPKQAVEIISAVCQGLSHAHENGVIHRDIKPLNILLTPDAQPKIGNFGLSRSSGADGQAMGTPGYMAPEIASQPETGNAQTDVYAVGIVLRELLTGVPADSADFPAAVVQDPKLAAICQKACHVDPSERYEDITSLSKELALWSPAKPSITVDTSLLARPQRPSLGKRSAALPVKAPSNNWTLLRNCAVIAFLLCAIHLVWGAYQTKQETLARLQQEQDAKYPTIRIVYLDDDFPASRTSSRRQNSALATTSIK